MLKVAQNLKILVASWLIQDGSFPDVQRGDSVSFGLEINTLENARLVENQGKAACYLADGKYKVVAQVVSLVEKEPLSESLLVIDFGVIAYIFGYPAIEAKVGDYISAIVYLEPLFNTLTDYTEITEIIYHWQIARIFRQAAPIIELKSPNGNKSLVRDKNKRGYLEVEQTKAWEDDGGYAEYYLFCTLINKSEVIQSEPSTSNSTWTDLKELSKEISRKWTGGDATDAINEIRRNL
jgi:hypothetical protein